MPKKNRIAAPKYEEDPVLSTERYVDDADIVALGKSLAWLLRAGAAKEGIAVRSDGYCDLQDVLNHRSISRFGASLGDINYVIENNDKKRF